MKEIVLLVSIFLAHQYTLLLAAPSIEACPADSLQAEDLCKCNYESCSKPPCLSELKMFANGSDTPGSCCPIYSCEGCANDTLLNDKCPCAPNAVLDLKNKCTCTDPFKTLIKDDCVCDPDLCPLPEICESNSVEVRYQDGCCEKIKCVKCPHDSYTTNYSDDAVEDICVCFPCNPKECGPDEVVHIIQHGKNYPGTCCDIYDCVSTNHDKLCNVDGANYTDGDNWKTKDGETCYCQNGLSFCSKPTDQKGSSCLLKNNVTYSHNESWLPDNCTNCTCDDGKPICISHYCDVNESKIKKSECHALRCNKTCPDGYKLNKLGCPICKCNIPSHKYDDLLHKYNITKNDLKNILDDYFAQNKSETTESITTAIASTTEPVSNISNTQQGTTTIVKQDAPYNWTVMSLCIGIPICIAILVVVLLILRYWCHGKKGSYDTNPVSSPFIERVKTKRDTLLNNYIMK